MKYAEMDDDGYPTDDTLLEIQGWAPMDLDGLMEYIKPIFATYGKIGKRGKIYTLATGGWSGCESAIGAMQSNQVFWAIHWQLSKRGGYYEFGRGE